MKILLIGAKYLGHKRGVHNFRQHFFDEIGRQADLCFVGCERQYKGIFQLGLQGIISHFYGNGKPDVIILFTIKKVRGLKGLEDFKGPIILYECDSPTYVSKVRSFLQQQRNIRLLTFEFFPDLNNHYPVEKLWLPPTITFEDKNRGIERGLDVAHCGDYSSYKSWHPFRTRFAREILPLIKSFDIEIRGKNLKEIGRGSSPITSSKDLSLFANSAKVMLAFPTKNRWLTHQYFYPSANGCLTVGIKPQGFDEQMIPECLVEVREDFADLEEKVKYYLDNKKERDCLVQKAYKHIQEKHSVKVRVKTLLDKIKEIG